MASVGPVSARTRTLGLVAAAALAAAAATVGVTVATRSHPAQTAALKPRAGFPPLYLDLGVRTDPAARAIRRGSDLYAHGRYAAALQVFDGRPELEAQVGAALAGWPTGTIQRLEALAAAHPASAVVRLNLGIAEFWAGQGPPALSAWRDAVRVEPDSPAAVSADTFLHPEFAPNLPFFVPSFPPPPGLDRLPPARQLDELARRARTGGAHEQLLYGIALQRLGRPISAERAFAAAARVAPADPDARVAAAVGLFSKADPTRAFARLGPLTARFPRAATVRFHLGELLLWTRQLAKARRQFQLAVQDAPGSQIGADAQLFLDKLRGAGTS
jgi:tetratricopeptide (TPR) repeat protein